MIFGDLFLKFQYNYNLTNFLVPNLASFASPIAQFYNITIVKNFATTLTFSTTQLIVEDEFDIK